MGLTAESIAAPIMKKQVPVQETMKSWSPVMIMKSPIEMKKKVKKMDELQTLQTPNTNKQTTTLDQKEQEH